MSATDHVEPGLRFGLFGVPIRIDPSFFIVFGLFAAQRLGGPGGFQGFVTWLLAAFVSLLAHEFGHAVLFRRFSLQPSITLYAMGGLTSAKGRLTWARSLATSLAGPISGFALAGLVWALAEVGIWPRQTLFGFLLHRDLLYINVLWGLLNLLPLHPLDGGHTLEAILHLANVGQVARKVAIASIGVALLGVAYGLYDGQAFLALVLGYLGWTNFQRLQAMGRSGPGRAA